MDGSVTGRPPPSDAPNAFAVVTNNLPFLRTSSCVHGEWEANTFFCPNHFADFAVRFVTPPTYPSDLSSVEGLILLYRNDLVDHPLVLCGGKCNGGTDVVEQLGPATSFFGRIMYWRDYYLHFNTSTVPEQVEVRVGGPSQDVNDTAEGLPPRVLLPCDYHRRGSHCPRR